MTDSENLKEYAVLGLGAKQQIVQVGDLVWVELQQVEAGKKIELSEVLLVKNAKGVRIGRPFVDGAKVKAEVVGEERGDKRVSFIKKRRKHSEKKIGHRQRYTLLRIESIH